LPADAEMKKLVAPFVAAAGAVALGVAFLSWGGFVREEHLVGPYGLSAADVDGQMSVYYDLDDGNAKKAELGLADFARVIKSLE
jgi:hypothetical protein